MRFFDYIVSAFRNLTRQKSRTALTITAITVGSLSLILMASLIIGIRQSLVDQFKNLGAFNLVTVIKDPNSTDNNNLMGTSGDTSEGKLITDVTLADLKKLDHVVAASPVMNVSFGTMRPEGQEKKTWASVVALDPTANVISVPLLAGRNLTSSDMDKVVVGSRFLDDFKYHGKESSLIGTKVIFNSKMGGGKYQSIDWGPLPEKPPTNGDWKGDEGNNKNGIDITAEIVGVADNSTAGDGSSYINIAWARRLNTMVSWQNDEASQKACQKKAEEAQQSAKQLAEASGQKYTGGNGINCQSALVLVKQDNFKDQGYASVMLKVDDTENIKLVSDAVTKLGYGAMTAQAMLDQINQIMTMVGIVLGLIAGISLFVAGIGIINTMVMATYERIREIGVMRACGATRAVIRRLFTFEAAMLGFWGGVFGMIISIILGMAAKLIVAKYGANFGNLPVENIGSFPWWLVVGVITFTTLVGMLSGLYPAIRAAKLNPVEALRYE